MLRRPITRAVALILFPVLLHAESSSVREIPPRQVVEKVWSMDMAGGRITFQGWYDAASFFAAQPASPQLNRDIMVVAGEFRVGEPKVNGDRATVAIGCESCRELGHLDSNLALKLSPQQPPRRNPRAKPGTWYTYDLVFSDKGWEFGPENRRSEAGS